MLVKIDPSEPPPRIKKIANAFYTLGWIGFVGQLGLAFVAVLALLFAASGRNVNPDREAGIGVGIFWSLLSLLVLCPAIVFAFRYTRIAKALFRDPDAHWHPRKADTLQLLRLAVYIGFIGMLLAIVGAGTVIVGVMVAKTVSQPPGIAITDPNKIVRALDVFVGLANIALIAAHFVGTVTSLWLLDRIHHHQ